MTIYNNPNNHNQINKLSSQSNGINTIRYNSFNNFTPRSYDYDSLGKEVIRMGKLEMKGDIFMNEVYRGDIFMAKFPKPQGKSSVQGGTRPVLILQNDIGNRYCFNSYLSAKITSQINKANIPTHVKKNKERWYKE